MVSSIMDYMVTTAFILFIIYLSVGYQKIKVKKMLESEQK